MDIESVSKILNEQYGTFYKSLMEISKDTSSCAEGVPLCGSSRCCYCYDDIIINDFKSKDFISSVDAVSVCGEYVNFIEFKNGKITATDIRYKITEGMYYFERFILQGNFLSANNIKSRFILVYNPQTCRGGKNTYRDTINNNIMTLSGNDLVDRKRFLKTSLSKIWDYFDESISLPVQVFEKELDQYVCCSERIKET